jgi:hypothetical protein
MSPCPHQGGTQGAKESISNDGLFYSNTKSDSYLGETLLSECREQGDCHFIVTSFTLSAIFLTATLTPFVLRTSPQIQQNSSFEHSNFLCCSCGRLGGGQIKMPALYAGICSHNSLIYFQTTSGLRTIQIRATPVMAPATRPLVTAMTAVPTTGSIRGSVNTDKTAWLTQ